MPRMSLMCVVLAWIEAQGNGVEGDGVRYSEIQRMFNTNLVKYFGSYKWGSSPGQYVDYPVSNYLRLLVQRGRLKRVVDDSKRVHYHISPSGIKYLDFMVSKGRANRSAAALGYQVFE